MSEKYGDEMDDNYDAEYEQHVQDKLDAAPVVDEQVIYVRATKLDEAHYLTTDNKQFFSVQRAECHQRNINRSKVS